MHKDIPVTVEELQDFDLFRLVPTELIEEVVAGCTVKELRQGDILLELDQTNRNLFLILTGTLRVHLRSPDSVPIALLHRGEGVGEMSLSNGNKACAFVMAETDCRLLVMDEQMVWSLIQRCHVAACNLLKILTKRLRNANSLITNRMHLEQEIHRYGTVDALTGIHNRYWFDQILPRVAVRMDRTNQPLSLIMFDIDHFKQFNDRYGHLCGDQAIHTVGRILMENLRPTNLAARFGGDEFLILLPGVSMRQALAIAERIRQTILETPIEMGDGSVIPAVTISMGIAHAGKGQKPEKLLGDADKALYCAKQNGRNRIYPDVGLNHQQSDPVV